VVAITQSRQNAVLADHQHMMAPTDQWFMYVPEGTEVQALVRWEKISTGMRTVVYAPHDFDLDRLPIIGRSADVIPEWLGSGELVAVDWSVYRNGEVWRVDDNRPGHNRSYLMASGVDEVDWHLTDEVVYLHTDVPSDEERGDPAIDPEEIWALQEEPETVIIEVFEPGDDYPEGEIIAWNYAMIHAE
jgi:hypothetical protein